MNRLITAAVVLLSLVAPAMADYKPGETAQDSVNSMIEQRLRKTKGPIQLTPYLTFDVWSITDVDKARMVVGLYLHQKICSTKAPETVVLAVKAIMEHNPPTDVEFNRTLIEAQKESDGHIGEWCRTITASFKNWAE